MNVEPVAASSGFVLGFVLGVLIAHRRRSSRWRFSVRIEHDESAEPERRDG